MIPHRPLLVDSLCVNGGAENQMAEILLHNHPVASFDAHAFKILIIKAS